MTGDPATLAGLDGVRWWVRSVAATSLFTTSVSSVALLAETVGYRFRFYREFGRWPYGWGPFSR